MVCVGDAENMHFIFKKESVPPAVLEDQKKSETITGQKIDKKIFMQDLEIL